jgi:type II secretory pathway pseudopilin PulG
MGRFYFRLRSGRKMKLTKARIDRSNCGSEKGLTLIEQLLALFVLVIVTMSMAAAFDQTLGANVYSKNRLLAANDAKKIMEQVRATADKYGTGNPLQTPTYWSNASNTGWLQTASFSSLPGKTMSVQFPSGNTYPLQVRAVVNWTEKGGTKTYNLDAMVMRRSYT